MNWSALIVNLAGAFTILWIVWYFWLYRKQGTVIAEVAGVQEAAITVKGGYDPDVIVVKRGKPVKLHFTRYESSLCSEMVIFDKLGTSAKLPEGKTVMVAFNPSEAGDIPFACQMGMLRGKVVVTD